MSEPYETEEYFSVDEKLPMVELPDLWLGMAVGLHTGDKHFAISIKREADTAPLVSFTLTTEARKFLQRWLKENFPNDK